MIRDSGEVSGPAEHFQIKWGQARLVSHKPFRFGRDSYFCQNSGGTNPHWYREPKPRSNFGIGAEAFFSETETPLF